MATDILKVKSWVIFLAFLLIVGPIVVLMDYIVFSLGNPLVTICGRLFVLAVYFLYPMLVGLKLRSLLALQTLYNRRNSVSLILDSSMVLIPYMLTGFFELHGELSNVVAIAIAATGVIGIVRIASFPAHEIRSIELRRNAGIWEYVSETVQMIYWPIGVLWMQPRINNIAARTITISE